MGIGNMPNPVVMLPHFKKNPTHKHILYTPNSILGPFLSTKGLTALSLAITTNTC